jgi:hypothetical protein
MYFTRHLALKPSLLEDAVERAWRYVDAGLAGDGDRTRAGSMLKLAVAAFLANDPSALRLEELQHLRDLHGSRMPQRCPWPKDARRRPRETQW